MVPLLVLAALGGPYVALGVAGFIAIVLLAGHECGALETDPKRRLLPTRDPGPL